MRKVLNLIFLFFLFIIILSCAKQKSITVVDNKIEASFEAIQEKIAIFLVRNFKIGSWQTDGVLTGKIDNLFSEIIINRNNISSIEYKDKLMMKLNNLLYEYEVYWEHGASDSIDARTMLISEIFFDLIRSMLETSDRAKIMNSINERVETYFPSMYDLGFLDYKIMIDLFDILTCPYDYNVIINKFNKLFEFIGDNPITEDGDYYVIYDNCYYHVDINIIEFINNLRGLIY
jgi:hypothetical protein